MDNSFTSQSPLAYPDWMKSKGYYADITQDAYLAYLNSWYNTNDKVYKSDNSALLKRQQYIQLIKDLLFLFNKNELDLFLSDIDFDNDEDLMYVIPYLASKLKQISQMSINNNDYVSK